MKSVIVYASVHHGNTKKLVEKIAEECKKPDIHSETQRENNGKLPKTESSIRKVFLPKSVAEMLVDIHSEMQNENSGNLTEIHC